MSVVIKRPGRFGLANKTMSFTPKEYNLVISNKEDVEVKYKEEQKAYIPFKDFKNIPTVQKTKKHGTFIIVSYRDFTVNKTSKKTKSKSKKTPPKQSKQTPEQIIKGFIARGQYMTQKDIADAVEIHQCRIKSVETNGRLTGDRSSRPIKYDPQDVLDALPYLEAQKGKSGK